MKLCKAAVGILRNICTGFVNQTIGQQKDLHAQLLRDHIFCHIVTDHQAFFRLQIKFLQDLPVVVQIWLAIIGIFKGGKIFKI